MTLDEYRRRQKLTLDQLAELLGIPYGTMVREIPRRSDLAVDQIGRSCDTWSRVGTRRDGVLRRGDE